MVDEVRLPKIGDWVSRTDFPSTWGGRYFEVIDIIYSTHTSGGNVVLLIDGYKSNYHLLSHVTVRETWLFKTQVKGGFSRWIKTTT